MMTEEAQINQLVLKVDAGEDSDALDRDEMLHMLQREVLELDLESVEAVRSETAPDGAKGGGELTGLMVMSMAVTLPALITLIQGWVARQNRPDCRVTIHSRDGSTVEISGDPMSVEDIASKIRFITVEGTYVEGDVNVEDGNFIGHDKPKE